MTENNFDTETEWEAFDYIDELKKKILSKAKSAEGVVINSDGSFRGMEEND